MSNPANCHVWHWTADLNLYIHIPVYYQSKHVIIIVVVFEMNVMYIDCVYGCYIRLYWLCIWCYIHVYWLRIWVLYTCLFIVYMGAIYMYIDGIYECYVHVYWLWIWVLYTCMLIVYMGAMYMYIDCVYGCYLHVYRLCIWMLCTCMLIVYMGAT